MTRVRVDDAAIAALKTSDDMRAALDDLGGQVAERARQSADVWSDEGFASIHQEVATGDDGLEARVSWDEEHFYMFFFEVGTSELAARPFLRPALEGPYDL